MEPVVNEENNGTSDDNKMDIKYPKNNKVSRYYYRHREEILEKKRLARLAKKGIDITKPDSEIKESIEERRKKKMAFLGILGETM
jgi:hypothetical protein